MRMVTLQLDETLLIGENVRVNVREIFHHVRTDTMQVRFGIEAPSDVLILRSELSDRTLPPEGS